MRVIEPCLGHVKLRTHVITTFVIYTEFRKKLPSLFLLYSLLSPGSTVLHEKLTVFSWSINSPYFMDSERSLPQSQVHDTCLYPESAPANPYPHIPLPEGQSLYNPPHLRLGRPSGIVPSVFRTNALYTSLLSTMRTTCQTHIINLHFITWTILGEE